MRPVLWVWRSGVAGDTLALTALLALTLLFYRQLIFGERIAADAGLFREVYPLRQLIGDTLRHGELPLWNPYLFTGVPLLADGRSAVLYPAAQLLRWLDAPEAFAVSVVAHGAVAVTGMYLCCRFGLGLTQAGAFVGAVVFALGGFMGANAVEPNIVEAAAWAPLALLGAALAHRRTLVAGTVLSAAALALSALAGQPTVTVLIAVAVWLLLAALGAPSLAGWRPDRQWVVAALSRLARALIVAAAVPALSLALAAVQVLPSLRLHRAVHPEGGAVSASARQAVPAGDLLRAILPGFNENPPRQFTGHVGVVALGLAVLGLRRGARPALFGLLCLGTGAAVALGDLTPVYRLLEETLAGWTLMERPALGLLLLSLGLAVLAATGLDALWPKGVRATRRAGWRRHWRDAVLGLMLLQVIVLALLRRDSLSWPGTGVREIWLGLAVIAVDVALLLPLMRPRWWLSLTVVAALAAELVVAGAQLSFTRTADRLAFEVEPAVTALLRGHGQPARVARTAGTAERDPPPEPGFAAFQALRQGRDRLAPNTALLDRTNVLEGAGGPLTPAPEFLSLWPAGAPPGVLPHDIRSPLGPRLGVTHVMGPPREPVVAGESEFIAGVPLEIPPGGEVRLSLAEPRPSTGVAFLADLSGAPPDGQPAVEIVAGITGAPDRIRTLVAGVDVGDAGRIAPARLVALPDGSSAIGTQQALGLPAVLQSLTIRNTSAEGRLRVYGLSLIDDRTGAFRPVILDNALEPVPGTSPTLWVDRRTPPRASLARSFEVENDTMAAVRRLALMPLDRVLVDRQPMLAIAPGAVDASESAKITLSTVNRTEVLVAADAPAVLVLRDAYAPGWRVTVDGRQAELLRVDGLFRGVAVPAGTHSVVFHYAPPGFRRGVVISGLSMLGTVAVLLLAVPRLGGQRRTRR